MTLFLALKTWPYVPAPTCSKRSKISTVRDPQGISVIDPFELEDEEDDVDVVDVGVEDADVGVKFEEGVLLVDVGVDIFPFFVSVPLDIIIYEEER